MAVGSTGRRQARSAVDQLDVLQCIDVDNMTRNEAEYFLHVAAIAKHKADALFGAVALRVEETEAFTAEQFLSAHAYVGYISGIEVGDARAYIEVAKALRELPEIDAEFRMGALSFDKVQAVVDGVAADSASAARLLDTAQRETVKQLKREVRDIQALANAEDAEQAEAKTYLRAKDFGPFHQRLDAVLTNEQWDVLRPAIDHHADVHFKASWKDGTFVSRDHSQAAGLVALATVGAPVPKRVTKPRATDISVESGGRYIPVAVRRRLLAEATSCDVEGCDFDRALQLDHNVELRDGGKTRYANLGPVCGPHHRYKTMHRMILEGPRRHKRMRKLRPDEMGRTSRAP